MDERLEGPSSPKKARGNEKAEIMEKSQPTRLDGSNAIWIKEIEDKMRKSQKLPSLEEATRITQGLSHEACIFRVPARLQRQSPEHYQPKTVAIGPYHRHNSKLPIKDEDKWCCVDYIVSKHSLNLEEWLWYMELREQEARDYYSEDVSMDSKSFLEMLLLDGCFILQALDTTYHRVHMECPREQIILDFLLLENQIPFFVLIQLYGCVKPRGIIDFIFDSFWDNLPLWEYISKLSADPNQVLHLLHLFHLFLVRVKDKSIDIGIIPVSKLYVPSATELHHQFSVTFTKNYTDEMLNIRFCNGVMEIPILEIYDDIGTLLRNLIAFEQCYSTITPYLTTYAAFMGYLMNKESDVQLLERSGILLNGLPTSKDAAFFFSKLSPWDKFLKSSEYLNHIIEDVAAHHENKWNRWYADLKLNYFSNTWVTLSAMSAAVLLILNFIQTYYAVITYYHR